MSATLLGVNTEGWSQVADLAAALVLSAAIGIEREIRQKSAGLRTHVLEQGLGRAEVQHLLALLVLEIGRASCRERV